MQITTMALKRIMGLGSPYDALARVGKFGWFQVPNQDTSKKNLTFTVMSQSIQKGIQSPIQSQGFYFLDYKVKEKF